MANGQDAASLIQLRGGFSTHDPRLDRLPSQNARRLELYPAEQSPLRLDESTPRTKLHRRGTLLDQAPDPSLNYDGSGCVAFSTLAFMRSSPVRNSTIKVPLGNVPVEKRGAIKLYHWFQEIDEWEETHPGGEGGTSVDAGARKMKELGVYDAYYWITNGVEELARVLQDQPAIAGTWWWSGMDAADRNGTGIAQPTGWRRGGHAWEIDGVLVDEVFEGTRYKYLFRGQQTWGRWGWHKNGTFWIPDAAMETLIEDQGEVLVPLEVMQAA